MSNLKWESFMTILADVWNKWATPDLIVKSGKRVGISINGLNVNWMQQDKFRRAGALLEPAVSSSPSSSGSSVLLSSPVGVRKKTSAYYLYKFNKSLELIEELQSTSVTPDELPGLLPLRKIAPKVQEKEKEKKKKEKCTEEGRYKNCFHALQR